MEEWIVKYWLQVLFGIVVAVLGIAYRKLSCRVKQQEAIDQSRGQLAGKQRVFRNIFEVAAAKRRALDVDAGSKDNGDFFLQSFFTNRRADCKHQVAVK